MKKAIVKESIAPMMLKPDVPSELSDEALHGMEVEILEEVGGDRVKIRTHYNYEGYTEKKYLCFDGQMLDRYRNEKKYTVNNNTLDVMGEPKVRGRIIKCLAKGSVLIKTGYSADNWCGVVTADGEEGFVRERLLLDYVVEADLSREEYIRKSLVDTAMSYLKTQYRWGGKTSQGIDCSGLTAMAYMLNGMLIYRDAHIKDGFVLREIPQKPRFSENGQPERKQGEPGRTPAERSKDLSNLLGLLEQGDLIFYPGHVVMYIGLGKYIHSSPVNDGVGINSLLESDPDYLEHLSAGHVTQIGTVFANENV